MSKETLIGIDQLIMGGAASCDLKDIHGGVAIPTGTPITPKLVQQLKESGVIGLMVTRPDYVSHHVSARRPNIEVIASKIEEMHRRSGIASPLSTETLNQTRGTLTACFKAVKNGTRPHIEALHKIVDLILHDIEFIETAPVPQASGRAGSLVERLVKNAIDSAILIGWHGRKSGFHDDELSGAVMGALLHDAGMLFVPEDIITQSDPLSAPQLREIRRHPYLAVRALSPFREKIPQHAMDVMLLHHERIDGHGYPLKRQGDQIPRSAALAHVIDAYIAMLSHRPHRLAYTPHQSIELLLRESGRSYDRNSLKGFIGRTGRYPVGCTVILSSNEVGIVIGQGKGGPFKPIVDVYFSRQHQFSQTPRRIDLGTESIRYVRQVVN